MNAPMLWRRSVVTSPDRVDPVTVVSATKVPYRNDANRLQTLSVYLPDSADTRSLVGTPVRNLPSLDPGNGLPNCLVHIHGGAWRSPDIDAASIEPTVAHAFASKERPIQVIASIDYSISPFPDAPKNSYDPVRDAHADPAREAVHPKHLQDVLLAFDMLRSFGLVDGSFILSGHSCGACLAFQAVLADPTYFGLDAVLAPPVPAAILGVNGLYDLPALVGGLDEKHAHLAGEYCKLLTLAFGADEGVWAEASPARIETSAVRRLLRHRNGPRGVLLEQSADDQLVPMNQRTKLAGALAGVDGLSVVLGERCVGDHAAPWEQGGMLWQCICDTLALCR